MVAINSSDLSTSEVKWIVRDNSNFYLQNLEHRNVSFYKKCLVGALTLSIGDFVLVSNADAAEPDTVAGCDIAKILYLYELEHLTSSKDPCRAVVQWYSRPESIPHKQFDSDDICLDFNCEIIEEHRAYDPDISLETIFRKCSVIIGSATESASSLMQNINNKHSSCPMFVCRYKFVKVKKTYKLIPLQDDDNDTQEKIMDLANTQVKRPNRRKSVDPSIMPSLSRDNELDVVRDSTTRKLRLKSSNSNRKRRASMVEPHSVEFVDIDKISNENKVSPIKIIGCKSVVRLSSNGLAKHEVNGNYLVNSPLVEKNMQDLTPTSRATTARRNLNRSIEKADTTNDSDCLNYSIIKNTPENQEPTNEMKIKLRLSERRRSTRLTSIDDPLNTDANAEEIILKHFQRKRLGLTENSTPNVSDIYSTPSKKSKDCPNETTPARRKSILKSATKTIADGTPKRNIQLSDIVEQRIFRHNEIIDTPKRARTKAGTVDSEINETKTPTRNRRSSKNSNIANEPVTLTPTQKLKLIRSGNLTPTIVDRQAAGTTNSKSNLQLARESLHVSVVPKSLPCRETEFDNIYTFVEGKIQDQCGGCMYISGVPGTGKTATVSGVMRMLQHNATNGHLPEFEFIEINGMRLTEPRQAYVQIYKQLTGKTLSWEHAHSLLEKRFTTSAPRRVTTVLLVDELDILCNRRQDVVYNLLDWPSKSSAQLVVITIANTMDLPERLLMGKVTSRLGLTRLTFQPYTHKQLQEIVTARLSDSETFKSDAVQLVARKVAAVSGDARRALDICRRATEIADDTANEALGSKKLCVNMLHVQKALSEMISCPKVQAIKNCAKLEKIFLQAIVAEVTRTGVEEVSFMGIYTQMEAIAAFLGVVVPSTGRTLRICSKLGSQRLIICEHSRKDIFQKILLNVSMDDIYYALKVNNI